MNDEFEGMGGSYSLDPVTGLRTLIGRTEDASQAPPTLTEVITPTKPAKAGFFTPVAPAETTTTE